MLMLTMVSMGAWAQIDVQIANDGKFDGGTIKYVDQTKPDEKGFVTVTITVTPNKEKGYTIKKGDISVYSTLSPSGPSAGTRTPEIADNLTLYFKGSADADTDDLSAERDYTFNVPSGFGAWVKEATFQEKNRDGAKTGETDESDVYFLGVGSTYSLDSKDNNFYLCPTEDWINYKATDDFYAVDDANATATPFLTTYKCRNTTLHSTYDKGEAKWIFVKHQKDGKDYYYIKHASDDKYLTYNGKIKDANKNRIRVHLEATDSPDDLALFNLVKSSSAYYISPITENDESKTWYLNVSQGNMDFLTGQSDNKNDGPTGQKNIGGTIGKWSAQNSESQFYLEPVQPKKPEITYSAETEKVTITPATLGTTIYYTTDGSDPTSSDTRQTYSAPFDLTAAITVKAIAVKSEYEKPNSVVETMTITPQCGIPTITNNDGTIVIETNTVGATIYYTTDGSDPTTSGTRQTYSAPGFSLDEATTVKAVATKEGYANSEVATFTTGQYVYIQSNADKSWYLYPSDELKAEGQPYVKTQKSQTIDAVWQLFETSSGYRIKHFADGKYLVADAGSTNSVHLEDAKPEGNSAIFEITETSTSGVYQIKPKDAANDGNKNYLSKGDNGKNISLAASSDNKTQWLLVTFPIPPVISVDDINFTVSSNPVGTVYYTTDGSDPAESETRTAYSSKVTLKYGPTYTVRAYTTHTVASKVFNSDEAESKTIKVDVISPTLSRAGDNINITSYQKGKVTYRYTFSTEGEPEDPLAPNGDGTGGTGTNGTSVALTADKRNIVKAIAYNIVDGVIYASTIAKFVVDMGSATEIENLNGIVSSTGNYKFKSGFSLSGTPIDENTSAVIGTAENPFKGTIDGNFVEITLGNNPLFAYVEDATIKNVIVSSASISTGAEAGAIANVAQGNTRIYNSGVKGGSITGNTDVGSIVGKLDGYSRVINCYSFATVSGGTNTGGIVGNNCYASNADNIRTMVMNCMYYGNISSGTNISPVYGGLNISNTTGGLNTFNYYLYESEYSSTDKITAGKYNSAIAVKRDNLIRFEYYRELLNSNKKLAAIYATGTADKANEMAKWVLETADRTIATPMQYPILKRQGKYPSIINYDAEHAPTTADRNKGKQIGTAISVTISESNTTSGGLTKPTGATVSTTSLTLKRTDKDYDHFNYNYDKVQLPYYNDVGTGNYTGNEVVTGWKITSITTTSGDVVATEGTLKTDVEVTLDANGKITESPYNFADRMTYAKDLYSKNGNRIFSQGAYFDVPYGVTAITIEPYWGKAAYLADNYYDVVYSSDYKSSNVSQLGTQITKNKGTQVVNGSNQTVYTSPKDALDALSGSTVFDNALVLIGNRHMSSVPASSSGTIPFTLMSIDENLDNEPDYSLIYHHDGRAAISPVRFDFINVVGTAMAQKPNDATKLYNVGIFNPKGWFEITNTCLIHFVQFEYDNGGKSAAPLIFLGGAFDQFTSTHGAMSSANNFSGTTTYIHVGGNAYFKNFSNGCHGEVWRYTPHIPISATGGDYDGFYLSGIYRPNAIVNSDNAEGYISGGRFKEVAGAAQQMIDGDVAWQIYDADITEFYGGGLNAAKPITGNITTNIHNSHVTTFCGGPKFGDMQTTGTITIDCLNTSGTAVSIDKEIDSDRTVTTVAKGCTFTNYYGAGYGGTSYNTINTRDGNAGLTADFGSWESDYTNKKGKYSSTNKGIATDFDYDAFVWSTGQPAGRFYVKYASFSLAETNDVSSTLTNCNITQNFYGGGNRGKVNGTATSILDNCDVTGSVYGAGYSASEATVDVRDGGFGTKVPKINMETGLLEEGTYTGTKEYTWKHGPVTDGQLAIANVDGQNVIYTTEDLSALGQVSTVELTIRGNSTIGGDVYGGGAESATKEDIIVNIENGTITGNVFGGGEEGNVEGNTEVNISGGQINGNVYGGGALADTNTGNWDVNGYVAVTGLTAGSSSVTGLYTRSGDAAPYTYTKITDEAATAVDGTTYYRQEATWTNATHKSALYTTHVSLTGGSVCDVFGGGLGRINRTTPANNIEAMVYGDVLVELNGRTVGTTTTQVADNAKGAIVSRVFGANNLNGSPQGNVTVHVYKTQNAAKNNITDGKTEANKHTGLEPENAATTYDVGAVYGGGNEANYIPVTAWDGTSGSKTQVIIEGCDRSSIKTVYGGGNAASVPETNVLVKECYEIEQVFGGGNGKDKRASDNSDNPGADIGIFNKAAYEADNNNGTYGTGNANSTIQGGYVHELFGASNEKGTIRGNITLLTTKVGDCNLKIDKIYNAGKNADVEGDMIAVLGCQPNEKIQEYYGGAENANVKGNVELTITNGTFGKIFAGNNKGGAIFGHIKLNIEETGCSKIIIDELYGCGNDAAYSVYGYYHASEDNNNQVYSDEAHTTPLYKKLNETDNRYYLYWDETYNRPFYKPRTSANDNEANHAAVYFGDGSANDHTKAPYADPEINIISATKIGKVFGGGFGEHGDVYGNPTVNINMIYGTPNGAAATALGEIGGGYTDENNQHVEGGVFGGGNAADVIGNTTVNIGTAPTVQLHKSWTAADGYTMIDDDNDGEADEKPVLGANILSNVYGGGNLADVTGNTFVNICAEYDNETEKFVAVAEGTSGVTIGGNVFGGGKGEAAESGDDAFLCARAMIGENGLGANPDYPNGNTSVRIGNGTVNGNVYGGGMFGRVEKNTVVTIGLEGTPTSEPEIIGNVYGGGQGEKHHGYAGLVRGNPTVTIQGNAKVRKSVYGGGEIASVARYKVAETTEEATAHGVEVGMPYVLANANSGKCTVTIKGNAEIGPDDAMKMYHSNITDGTDKPDDYGHVFGAGRGVLPEIFTYQGNDKPYRIDNDGNKESYDNENDYFAFIQTLALSTDTHVTIDGNAFVKGSVYGGSENGLVQYDTYVTINSGQIGCGKNTTKRHPDTVWGDNYEVQEGTDLECAHWDYGKDTNGDTKKDQFAPYDPYAKYLNPSDKKYYYDREFTKYAEGGANIATDGHTYYGNVFGGGSGSVPYFDTQQGISRYISTAGEVKGNTHVTIKGGHILTNVYGGNEATNVLGTAYVTMEGGTVGVPRTAEQIKNHPVTCYVFGAGKGDQRIFFNKETNVNDAIVTITGGRIYGSVFGGGEDGHVLRNTTVTIGKTDGTGPTIGTVGSTYVDGNVFGGGRGFGGEALTSGNVGGAVDLTINGGTMLGSIYGGGRLASVGYGLYLVDEEVGGVKPYGVMRPDNVDDKGNTVENFKRGYITVTVNGGTIGKEFADDAEGEHSGNVFGGSMGRLTKLDGTPFDDADHWALLATAKSTTVNINGGTIKRSVYGGGEMGTVTTNATVNVSGGTIGTLGKGGAEFGNVYGGGKGYVDPAGSNYVTAGIIKGNTTVAISGTSQILHNVYGGGAYGSVGEFNYDATTGMPTGRKENTTGGIATITITGGTIGTNGDENGMVFGSSRGDVGAPGEIHDKLAWVYDANVVIGTSGSNDGPQINGSVYGSGENGHTFNDATVNIHGGTIGIVSGSTITTNDNGTPNDTSDDTTYSGAEYPYRGNVYGGGCGTDMYDSDSDGNGDTYNPLAGIVQGNAFVNITGGLVVHNVYGAGAMGSVGTDTSGGKTTVSISGGRIGYDGNNNGNVYGAARGDFTATGNLAQVRETAVNISYTTTPAADNEEKTAQLIAGSVFGGGEAGTVKESVAVNMTGGLILNDVYGGGALADTQTSNWDASKNEGVGGWAEGKTSASNTTTVNLLGGTIGGDAYGGGLGQKKDFYDAKGAIATSDIEATVYGDITVNLGTLETAATNESPAVPATATAFNVSYEDTDDKDESGNPIKVVKSGRVFGCNNLNGSPQGNVTVNVYETVAGNVTRTAADPENPGRANRSTDVEHKYEVAAVYGGGNLANYSATGKKASVTIHTCHVSVQHVYGGGNAAAVPETDVLVKGAYEIEHVFGGGNGKDKYKKGNEWILNAGADVTGNTNTLLIGGYIHEAYGGSNEKGTIGGNVTINTVANDLSCDCALELVKLYGAGKNADIDGDLIVVLDCAPETKTEEIYGGAENANVRGNVELTITSGTFGKVFGGNNQSGAIFGHIILNIEETSCRPIIIDELYGCGNNAAYSVYGYKNGTDAEGNQTYLPRTLSSDGEAVTFKKDANQTAHTTPPYDDPQVNIISCTRIGQVFGGGYGAGATVWGNPTVNIDQIPGKFATQIDRDGNGVADNNSNALGEIGDVFGGGNEANVVGNTNVNIGTRSEVWLHQSVDGDGNYTRYPALTDPGISVVGANITGNVYGGGNKANVTGNTNVNIGKATTTP